MARVLSVLAIVVIFVVVPTMGFAQQTSTPSSTNERGTITTLETNRLVVTLADGSTQSVELPCQAQDSIETPDSVYVACGPDGVLVISLQDPSSPEIVGFLDFGGEVTEVFRAKNRIWAQVARVEARPITEAQRTPAPAVEPRDPGRIIPPATPAPADTPDSVQHLVEGDVVEVGRGYVIVDLGQSAGVSRNDRIELFVEREVGLGEGQTATREEIIAVGQVTVVSEERSQIKLGLNERVPDNARARKSNRRLTSTQWAPPRPGDLWEVHAMFRPFLALGTLGVGMVSDVAVSYLFDAPFTVSAVVSPLGIGLAERGNIFTIAGHGMIAYDTTPFKVGLGVGWSTLNDRFYDAYDPESERIRSAFSIAQSVRLGSSDGINLEVFNAFMAYRQQFEYAGTHVSAQVPTGIMAHGTWLVARGGGSSTGHAFGEIGLRVLVRGNGDRGSLFLTPTLGGAQVRGQTDTTCPAGVEGPCVEHISYGGPMIGFGLDWRL